MKKVSEISDPQMKKASEISDPQMKKVSEISDPQIKRYLKFQILKYKGSYLKFQIPFAGQFHSSNTNIHTYVSIYIHKNVH